MPYTFEDFVVDYILEHLPELPRDQQRKVLECLAAELRQDLLESQPAEQYREWLQSLPVEERLAGLSEEEIRQYLEQRAVSRPTTPRRPRRKRQ